MDIIKIIVNLYENVLPKNPIMLSYDEAIQYFERLLMNGNIITYIRDEELLGFIEFWRISYEQFGRICCNLTLTHDEDILSGNICLITRMYIIPDLRNAEAFINLGKNLIDKNKECTHFAAMQFNKKHKPLQVYSRSEIMKHYKI